MIYNVMKPFKSTNVKVAFKATNTIFQQLTRKPQNNNPPGIYRTKCNMCRRSYVGQTGLDIATRCKEHTRYIKNNNPVSAYAMHILHNRHEYDPASSTLKLLKQWSKGNIMNIWEATYIQTYNQHDLLVPEQNCMGHNPLFNLAHMPLHDDTVEMSNSHSPTLH
jgi:hypothetical protein